ncbi:hypothetical protein SBRCBS47491_007262 [Sporothrix bragantina]|uniref:DUF7730 domain-containing protein n=1 Tax=Sporothrix bragantina TaxID=671064 RepID=A0ABP0CBR6_9PEZI
MQSPTRPRAEPPLLGYFTATAAPVAAFPATTSNDGGPASQSHLPPPTQPTDTQDGSLFFTHLPSEIRRMIYVEVWRTYGSDGYEDDDDFGHAHSDGGYGQPRRGSSPRGGLSPHITAAFTPSKSWLTAPFPSSSSATNGTNGGGGSSSRSDGGSDDPQQQQPRPSLSTPPWTRQIRGFTSAPCFLAVDDVDDNDNDSHKTAISPRRPPEADDVRPARLAAAHTADLDAAAASNSNSIWQGEPDQGINNLEAGAIGIAQSSANQGPSSSTWRARWNSPWLGHWACEEYYSGAAASQPPASPEAAAAEAARSAAGGPSVRSEDHRRRRPPLRRPYLPILLTCRRAYIEGIDLLYSALTFQFTEMATAEGFLARWPCVSSVRLIMHLSTSLLDFYRHADNDADQGIITAGRSQAVLVPNDIQGDNGGHPAPGAVTIGTFPRHDDERDRGLDGTGGERGTVRGTVVNARNNQWQHLCASLGPDHLPNLRRLHVWVEAHDLRGWHKAAAETRLFAKLLESGGRRVEDEDGMARRRLTADNFVLYLPTLPADAKTHGLPGCYLGEENESSEDTEDGRDREALPCTIVRTERPDYWDVHLNMRPVFVNRRMSIGSRVAALRRAGFL